MYITYAWKDTFLFLLPRNTTLDDVLPEFAFQGVDGLVALLHPFIVLKAQHRLVLRAEQTAH